MVRVLWVGCDGRGRRGGRRSFPKGDRSVSLNRDDFRAHRNEKLRDLAASAVVDDHLNDRSYDRLGWRLDGLFGLVRDQVSWVQV